MKHLSPFASSDVVPNAHGTLRPPFCVGWFTLWSTNGVGTIGAVQSDQVQLIYRDPCSLHRAKDPPVGLCDGQGGTLLG